MNLNMSATSYRLPLKYPFTISRYTVDTQETVIVSISNGAITGYGEATVNPYYKSTVEKIMVSVESVTSIIENSDGAHQEDLWNQLA